MQLHALSSMWVLVLRKDMAIIITMSTVCVPDCSIEKAC